jgi:XTP/dITP diphosphohydrolase
MTELLLATRNRHKTREFAELLGSEFPLCDLTTEPGFAEIEETGRTFEENAILKARAVSNVRREEIVIADDSGLEVTALGGAPGVSSARYAGPGTSDRENVEKLLLHLAEERDRSARFICVIAICHNGRLLETVSGNVNGRIVLAPRGENGFGYDPVFLPEGGSETFGELLPQMKNQISHRVRAVQQLRQFLLSRID